LTWAIEKLFTVEVGVGVGVGVADGLADALAVVGVTLGLSEADAVDALEAGTVAGAEQAARARADARGTAMMLRTRRTFIGGAFPSDESA
jgi:hypothetical protein